MGNQVQRIETEDERLFCKKITTPEGDEYLEGAGGTKITWEDLTKQFHNPSTANRKRNKHK